MTEQFTLWFNGRNPMTLYSREHQNVMARGKGKGSFTDPPVLKLKLTMHGRVLVALYDLAATRN